MNRIAKDIIHMIDIEKEELIHKFNESNNDELLIKIHTLDWVLQRIHRFYEFDYTDNIERIIHENHHKHDTLLKFIDGTEFLIKKNWDHLITVDYICINIHSLSEDKTIIPPIVRSFNISNIREIETIMED